MAKVAKQLRLLFFINGPLPSEEDKAEAVSLFKDGFDVAYRNARLVSEGEALEAFDDVAGEVPPAYAAAKIVQDRKRQAANAPLGLDPEPPIAPVLKGAAAKAAAKEAAKTSGKTEKPADAGALAALSGGQQPPPVTPAPEAPLSPPAPVPGAAGDLTGGWGGQQPPPGAAPDWKPNA